MIVGWHFFVVEHLDYVIQMSSSIVVFAKK